MKSIEENIRNLDNDRLLEEISNGPESFTEVVFERR